MTQESTTANFIETLAVIQRNSKKLFRLMTPQEDAFEFENFSFTDYCTQIQTVQILKNGEIVTPSLAVISHPQDYYLKDFPPEFGDARCLSASYFDSGHSLIITSSCELEPTQAPGEVMSPLESYLDKKFEDWCNRTKDYPQTVFLYDKNGKMSTPTKTTPTKFEPAP